MEIHPQFRLNGYSFCKEELIEVAYSWVKEGDSYEVSTGDFLLDWLNDSSTIPVKTSGSTGTPKTIQLQKKHMVNSALATGEYFHLRARDAALQCLSSDYIAGKMMMVRAMVLGLHLDVVIPASNPLELLKKSYDFCAMVPLQVQNSISQLASIKKLIIGGAPVSKSLRGMLQLQSNEIYETYGMTETITHIAVKKISNASEHFEILPNVTIVKDGRGCLTIDAPHITSSKVTTNDLVEIIDEKHFKWLGRYDNIINSGGVKLIPEQIESKLSEVIENRFFVHGLPDEELGEKLILMVEGNLDSEKLLEKINRLASLDKFEIPKVILTIPKFLETQTGKVNRIKTLELL